jgi:hypothetical protein
LNRQVRTVHQVQEDKSKRTKISKESFWLKVSAQKAFGFEDLGELFLLGGSNPISGSAFLAGISRL